MKLKNLFNKKIQPIISYSLLSLEMLWVIAILWSALNSPLIFWQTDKDQFYVPVGHLNSVEYKQFLMENAVETFKLGQVKGKPNFTENNNKFDSLLKEASKKYKVDCTLIKATMLAESRGNPKIRSGAGAIGLMQLMPQTARAMAYGGNLSDPKTNIMAGTKYMLHLKDTACHEKPKNEVCDVKKDIKYRLAAYNGGSRCNQPGDGQCAVITSWECIYYDAYGETRTYVDRVKANYKELKDKNWGC